ncbi:MAG: SufE family protein [Pseudomonadota bacterium]
MAQLDPSEIEEAFELIDDWEERYRYVIELGRELPELRDELRTPATKVEGCASQVWIATGVEDDRLCVQGDSDAMIVRGLVAILLAYYNGRALSDVSSLDPTAYLAKLQLAEHLTPQRANGLNAMVKRIQRDAAIFSPA